MPIYEFECLKCGKVFEKFYFLNKYDGNKPPTCECGKNSKCKKIISSHRIEKLYPTLGSKSSAYGGGSVPNRLGRKGFSRKKY